MEKGYCVFCGEKTDLAENLIKQKEQYDEYHQVAALACMDLELLADISEESDITLEELKEHIKYTNVAIKRIQTEKEYREMRFNAAMMIFNIPVEVKE